jgi:hypothetical protein
VDDYTFLGRSTRPIHGGCSGNVPDFPLARPVPSRAYLKIEEAFAGSVSLGGGRPYWKWAARPAAPLGHARPRLARDGRRSAVHGPAVAAARSSPTCGNGAFVTGDDLRGCNPIGSWWFVHRARGGLPELALVRKVLRGLSAVLRLRLGSSPEVNDWKLALASLRTWSGSSGSAPAPSSDQLAPTAEFFVWAAIPPLCRRDAAADGCVAEGGYFTI